MTSSDPNKLFPNQSGFPTPNFPPIGVGCRTFYIPETEEYYALLMGALYSLIKPYNWYVNGEMSISEACEFWQGVIDDAYENAELGQCASMPAPYWDEATTADDEEPADTQPWYGFIEDFLAPIDELSFVENAAVWAITGFVAYAATPGAAIFFRTVARRFVLAVQVSDVGEIIRVIVDATEYNIDTAGKTEGEIVELEIPITDPDIETHDIYVINTGIPE